MASLEFHLENTDILPAKVDFTRLKEYERINYDLPFKILIEGKVFFYDAYFTILDFLYAALCWQKDEGCEEMIYNSCDTDDNPLISFKYTSRGWYIESPWEKFKCKTYLTKVDLFNAIDSLKKSCNLK